MNKFKLFMGALLVGGATLTMTSCIDTTEPAGIEAMRNSKSEYLKAKAGYENALTQLKLVEVEKEKVAVEAAKIALELDKIAVEQAQLALNKQTVLDSLALVLAEAQNQLALANIQFSIDQLKDEAALNELAWEIAQAQHEADLAAIALEVARLNKQMAELNDEIAQKELEKEEYLLQREATLLNLYQSIAQAEQYYLQAVTNLKMAMLTYKDEKMQAKLADYESELLGYNSQLSYQRAGLANAQLQKWSYETNKEMFVKELPVEKAKKEKEIALQKSYIAKLQELNTLGAGDITALYAQQEAYQEQLDALFDKQDSLVAAIEEMKKVDPAVAEEVAALNLEARTIMEEWNTQYDNYLAKGEEKFTEYPITIAKDDVSESMVATLAQALMNIDYSAYLDAFQEERDPQSGAQTFTMVNDFMWNQPLNNFENGVAQMVEYISWMYKDEYATAYRSAMEGYYYYSADELFGTDGRVKPEYLAKLEAAQDRLGKDESELAALKVKYDTTYANWGEAYAEYLAASAKFKGYQNNAPEFEAAWKAVEAYKAAKKDTLTYAVDGNKAGKEAAALYEVINNFIEMKNAVDGMFYDSFSEDFAGLYVDKAKIQDTTGLDDFNNLVASWYDVYEFEYFVGGKLPATEYWSDYAMESAAENGGALAKFLVLTREFLGRTYYSIAEALIPVKNGDKYELPEGTEFTGGVWDEYNYAVYLSENAEKIEVTLNGVEKWVILCENIKSQADAAKSLLAVIDEELAAIAVAANALRDEYNEIQEQIEVLNNAQFDMETIWAKEYECFLINGDWASVTGNNPYYTAYNNTNNVYSVVTERSVILKAKKVVDDAINEANGYFSYWFYNPKTESMEQVANGSLSYLLESAEYELANLEKDLEKLNVVIEAVAKFDASADSWESFFNGNYTTSQYIDAQIAEYEATIANLENRVDVVEAAIAALIAAYEAGALDVDFPNTEA